MTRVYSSEELAYYAKLVEGLDDKAARKKLGQYGRTPRTLFDGLHDEFNFDLDGAANTWDALLPDYNSEDSPAGYSWPGLRVFVNPPFTLAGEFARKAAEDHAQLVVAILPASFNSRWYHTYVHGVATQVRVPIRRIQFAPPPLAEYSTNRADTMIVVWAGVKAHQTALLPCDPNTGRVVRAA